MKIVLTGGPSAGKTTLVQIIEKEFDGQVASVPEAAHILFKGGFPRNNEELDLIYQQRAIYYVQFELESLVKLKFPGKHLVCDRGSLDGLAYWPHPTSTDFFDSLQTSPEKEVSRYDYVIHMETSHHLAYDISNPVRIESYEEAKKIDDRIKNAWAYHPNRIIIANTKSFSQKVEMVLEHVRKLFQKTEG